MVVESGAIHAGLQDFIKGRRHDSFDGALVAVAPKFILGFRILAVIEHASQPDDIGIIAPHSFLDAERLAG
jgi:hypothetical protein